MRPRKLLLLAACLVVLPTAAFADYLQVRRSAIVRADPARSAAELVRVERGAYLVLAAEQQTDGYYRVQIPSTGEEGWIYRTFVRRYRGDLPAALVAPAAVAVMTKQQCLAKYKALGIADCPNTGCAGDPELNKKKNIAELAQDKNAEPWELAQIIDLEEETPRPWKRGSPRGELEAVGESKPVVVRGYLIEAHLTKTPEACNCYLRGEENNDFHLNLVSQRNQGLRDSVVAEMTPRIRPSGWNRATLARLAEEVAYVRLTGWLLYDSMHTGESSFRATAWEIHPVTKFEVCTASKKACDAGSGWENLEEP